MGSSRILIIGGTGYIGRHITAASLSQGHPTFLLVRESSASNPDKVQLIESFKSSGATILHGSIEDYASLVEAIKKVDIVISAITTELTAEQFNLIKAIKEAGTIKRFLPSEFGMDVDRQHAVEPIKSVYDLRIKLRRAIEAEGIPYTFVCANVFAGFILPNLAQIGLTSPPRDKVVIYGDGNTKAVYVKEEDVGTFTIKSVDDPRTLNKILYLRLPANTLSYNELVALWEKKIGKSLEKEYLSEEQVLKLIEDTPLPKKIYYAIFHTLYVKGDQTNFEIGPDGVEASQLYPDVKYTTVDEYLNPFV
ncbi:hypothetical protein SUGI_0347910 [Cryptomeria japonica]|uniref:phenylcoumaran benzylic ether reductase IRL1 n=1 Tax=Cryptomeria japonica TaxID=3369 RepID=UPI002408CE3C|nr:phenylcoumaran benzylic ether reductase IRL1 [Cryptomeria japonica]GLJ19323.1 hypothetical protein SUGI_0347910 [Cryptomeria japonica]